MTAADLRALVQRLRGRWTRVRDWHDTTCECADCDEIRAAAELESLLARAEAAEAENAILKRGAQVETELFAQLKRAEAECARLRQDAGYSMPRFTIAEGKHEA